MRKVLIIAWIALSRLFRDRKALITLLLMPMVLIGILGAALGSMMDGGGLQPFDVIVVNEDKEAKPTMPPGTPKEILEKIPATNFGSRFVTDVLGSDQVKEILNVTSESDLTKAIATVSDGKAVAVIHVPATFSADIMNGKASKVNVHADPGNPTRVQIVEQIVRSFTDQVTTGSLAAQVLGPTNTESYMEKSNANLPKVVIAAAGGKRVKAIQYYAAAMAVMFMVMTAFNRAKDILQEKHDGTFARILVSPTSKGTLIAGQILGNMAIVLAQFAILMIGTRLLYQVSWGDWTASLLLGTAFALAAAGIGTAAAGIFNDPRAADSATGVIGMIFAALSGSMFPLYMFPDTLKLVAKFIPNYWALQGFLDQMSGLGLSYLWLPVAVLSAIGVVTAGVGAWRLAAK
ncbi:MAG TPA: ABC transporter permease [Symbiobacteriaceae bacterium]|nr:ABC transporter permease [Symbiobacteriaceae bacterium]